MSRGETQHHSSFPAAVIPLARNVLLKCNELTNTSQENIEDFIPLARDIAILTEKLSDCVHQQVNSISEALISKNRITKEHSEDTLLLVNDLIVQCITDLQSHVLDLVKAMKAAIQNPFSYSYFERVISCNSSIITDIDNLNTSIELVQIFSGESAIHNSQQIEKYKVILDSATQFASDIENLTNAIPTHTPNYSIYTSVSQASKNISIPDEHDTLLKISNCASILKVSCSNFIKNARNEVQLHNMMEVKKDFPQLFDDVSETTNSVIFFVNLITSNFYVTYSAKKNINTDEGEEESNLSMMEEQKMNLEKLKLEVANHIKDIVLTLIQNLDSTPIVHLSSAPLEDFSDYMDRVRTLRPKKPQPAASSSTSASSVASPSPSSSSPPSSLILNIPNSPPSSSSSSNTTKQTTPNMMINIANSPNNTSSSNLNGGGGGNGGGNMLLTANSNNSSSNNLMVQFTPGGAKNSCSPRGDKPTYRLKIGFQKETNNLAVKVGSISLSRRSNRTLDRLNNKENVTTAVQFIQQMINQYPWFAEKWATESQEQKNFCIQRLEFKICVARRSQNNLQKTNQSSPSYHDNNNSSSSSSSDNNSNSSSGGGHQWQSNGSASSKKGPTSSGSGSGSGGGGIGNQHLKFPKPAPPMNASRGQPGTSPPSSQSDNLGAAQRKLPSIPQSQPQINSSGNGSSSSNSSSGGGGNTFIPSSPTKGINRSKGGSHRSRKPPIQAPPSHPAPSPPVITISTPFSSTPTSSSPPNSSSSGSGSGSGSNNNMTTSTPPPPPNSSQKRPPAPISPQNSFLKVSRDPNMAKRNSKLGSLTESTYLRNYRNSTAMELNKITRLNTKDLESMFAGVVGRTFNKQSNPSTSNINKPLNSSIGSGSGGGGGGGGKASPNVNISMIPSHYPSFFTQQEQGGDESMARLSLSQNSFGDTIQKFHISIEAIVHTFSSIFSQNLMKINSSLLRDQIRKSIALAKEILLLISMQRNESASFPPHKLEQNIILRTFQSLKSIEGEEANGEIVKAISKDGIPKIVQQLKLSFCQIKSRLQIISLQIGSCARLILTHKDSSQSSFFMFAASLELLIELIKNLIKYEKTYYLVVSYNNSNTPSMNTTSLDDDKNINFWDEFSKLPQNIPQNSDISKATINQLIAILTDTNHLDKEFQDLFLTVYPSIISTDKLILKLKERYDVPENQFGSGGNEEIDRIHKKVFSFLLNWIVNFHYDFDENGMKKFEEFLHYAKNNKLTSPQFGNVIKHLFKEVEKKLSMLNKIFSTAYSFPSPLPVNLNSFVQTSNQEQYMELFHSLSPDTIARQLCLIDFQIFSSIQSTELLNLSWNNPKTKYKSLNTIALINRQNKLTFWVATVIILQDTLKKRVEVWEKFIRIAEKLHQFNNYNTLMGIIAALNLSATQRLKHTKFHIKKNLALKFSQVEKIMDPYKSWANLRSVLEGSPLPTIPYFGVFLTDLTFIEDGNKDIEIEEFPSSSSSSSSSSQELIFYNWKKRKLACKVLNNIKKFQSSPYQFPVEQPAYSLLYDLPSFTEDDLYALSLLREPKNIELKTLLAQEKS